MKYLIVGLGNPGIEYVHTRHNVGFQVLDKFSQDLDTSFSSDRHADIAETVFKGRRLVLIKPNTFMNLSGKAVNYWMHKMKCDVSNILVVTDDISLPYGKLRMRSKGSDGGHNGLKNITEIIKDSHYPRLRFGIGGNFLKGRQSQYVLDSFNLEEQEVIVDKINMAIDMIKGFTTLGIDRAMNIYNSK